MPLFPSDTYLTWVSPQTPTVTSTARTCSKCIAGLLLCFVLFCSFHSLRRANVPRSSYEPLKICSAPHLSPNRVHIVLNGSRPGAGVRGTGAQGTIFRCYQLPGPAHAQEGGESWLRFKLWAADRHAPCPAAKPASCPALLPR